MNSIENPRFNPKEFQESASNVWKLITETTAEIKKKRLEKKRKIEEEVGRLRNGIGALAYDFPERLDGQTFLRVYQHRSPKGDHPKIAMGENLKSMLRAGGVDADFESEEVLMALGKELTGKRPSGNVTKFQFLEADQKPRKTYFPPQKMLGDVWFSRLKFLIKRDITLNSNLCSRPFNRYTFIRSTK